MHKLANTWTLWIHLPYDTDWSLNSYKKISNFNTLEEAIIFIENINKNIIEKCMIFVMKNNIKPIWEDPENKNGGCFSYKINIDHIYDIWKILFYNLICNIITHDNDLMQNINGISLSPKKNFSILKFWIKTTDNSILKYTIPDAITQNTQNTQNTNDDTNSNYYLNDPLKLHSQHGLDEQLCIYKTYNNEY